MVHGLGSIPSDEMLCITSKWDVIREVQRALPFNDLAITRKRSASPNHDPLSRGFSLTYRVGPRRKKEANR